MDNQNDMAKAPPKALKQHANRHVQRFLDYSPCDEESKLKSCLLQTLTDGSKLTTENLKSGVLNISNPISVLDGPASIGLTVPTNKKKGENYSVRNIMNVVGHHHPVSVIDVANQEELEGWTMEDLVDYFEDETRLLSRQDQQSSSPSTRRPRRRAAVEAAKATSSEQRPKVLNQISMEFSKTPLQRLVVRPKFVRDMDWIDLVWPQEDDSPKPVVQHYCLTSTAGCFTDFHVDFGGTAVWYHVLEGQKEFILIPPTAENLQAYETWLCHAQQAELFLPDLLKTQEGVVKVTLKKSKTLLIPTGWIHAVYTPCDSIVVGGNFLHGLDMRLQLEIYCVETRAKVLDRFRFPFFIPTMYFAGAYYVRKLQEGKVCQAEVEGLPFLLKALREWSKMHSKQGKESGATGGTRVSITPVGAAQRAAQMANCFSVDHMLDKLEEQLERVVEHGICPIATPSTTPTKKKLSIKLATTTSLTPRSQDKLQPKLRLKLGGSNNSDAGLEKDIDDDENNNNRNEFRIVVPQSSMYALPSKKRKSMLSREDIVDAGSILTKDDEEWRPSGGSQRKGGAKIKKSTASPKKKRVSLYSIKQQPDATTAPARRDSSLAVSRKKPTTSRQRLMKRFR